MSYAARLRNGLGSKVSAETVEVGRMGRTVTKIFEFRTCTVAICNGWIETKFREDASVSNFIPPEGDEGFEFGVKHVGLATAWEHGVQHELGHCLIADALGQPHSWSVWSAAHGKASAPSGKWPQRVADEEHLVVSLQRLANQGIDDDYGALQNKLGEARHTLAGCLRRLTEEALLP